VIEANGREYALGLLDTNILSGMLKDIECFGKRVLERIDLGRTLVAITTYSVQELRRRPDLFDRLIDMMTWLPMVMLKTGGVLLDDEVGTYSTRARVDPVLVAPLGIRGPAGMPRSGVLRAIFENPEVATRVDELACIIHDC
jgi:hypothetical protein